MIHFSTFASRLRASAPSTVLEPLTAPAYLRLRRKAARLSIEQVAARIAPSITDRPDAVLLVTMLEGEGTKARHRETLDRLNSAFSLDPDVYRQLATEPADRHPQVCRGCGCSHWDPCICGDGTGTCGWAAPNICTSCSSEPAATPDDVL